jgi:hypothetical protein
MRLITNSIPYLFNLTNFYFYITYNCGQIYKFKDY